MSPAISFDLWIRILMNQRIIHFSTPHLVSPHFVSFQWSIDSINQSDAFPRKMLSSHVMCLCSGSQSDTMSCTYFFITFSLFLFFQQSVHTILMQCRYKWHISMKIGTTYSTYSNVECIDTHTHLPIYTFETGFNQLHELTFYSYRLAAKSPCEASYG